MRQTDESSPDVSWLQTTTTTGTTPSKYTPSIKNGQTGFTDFAPISELDPALLKAPTKNLYEIYDTKISDLQDKLLQNEREKDTTKILSENANKLLLQNSDLEIERLKDEIANLKNKVASSTKENKKYFSELTSVKAEMAIIGSEPVNEQVLLELKKRGNLTTRQVAELRLFDILKPLYIELEEKNIQLKKLFSKCKNFEQICSENQVSIEGVSQMKNNYVEQLTRNRLELVDAKNQLARYESLSKEHTLNLSQLKSAKDQITSLSHQLEDKKVSHHQELNYRIKSEKELAVIREQLNLVTSDKKYLESDKIAYESKLSSVEAESNIRWKELENLKIKLAQEAQSKIRSETRNLELSSRIERLEKEVDDSRKMLSSTDNFNKQVTMRAQHDTDLVHEKLANMVTQKNLFEEKNKSLKSEIIAIKDDFERIKRIYEKDTQILEDNLLAAERRSESFMTEKLQIKSKLGESEIDVETLQKQLQVLYNKVNSSEDKFNRLYQATRQSINQKEFDFKTVDIPGIDDLEQAIHDRPFSTAVVLARRLFQIQGGSAEANNTNALSTIKSSSSKQIKLNKLKKSNENLIKTDLQNMLKITNQVSKLRAILKQIMSIETDNDKLLSLQQEYAKLSGTSFEDKNENTRYLLNNLKAEKLSNVVSKEVFSKFDASNVSELSDDNFELYQEAVHPVNLG